MKPENPNETDEQRADRKVSTPYGPQHAGTDESAGGADSSPFENESTGAPRKQTAEMSKQRNLLHPEQGT